MTDGAVLGVDGCPGGWVGVRLDGRGASVAAFAAATVAAVVDAASPVAVIGIDIPIGLAETGLRRADLGARVLLGARRSTLFVTPPRGAMEAPTYAEANAACRLLAGVGLSKQAYALRSRVLEVDAWISSAPAPVYEVHPELSFAAMAGAPLRERKATWAGAARRRAVLAAAGIVVPDDLGAAGNIARVDDVLDAAAVAWTAARVGKGTATCVPDPPESLGSRAAAIWT